MTKQSSHDLIFYLTPVYIIDEKTGDITAFFAQFPEAAAQGRDKDEAKKLLFEIFPHMLNDKKEQFLKDFHPTPKQTITYDDVQMVNG